MAQQVPELRLSPCRCPHSASPSGARSFPGSPSPTSRAAGGSARGLGGCGAAFLGPGFEASTAAGQGAPTGCAAGRGDGERGEGGGPRCQTSPIQPLRAPPAVWRPVLTGQPPVAAASPGARHAACAAAAGPAQIGAAAARRSPMPRCGAVLGAARGGAAEPGPGGRGPAAGRPPPGPPK